MNNCVFFLTWVQAFCKTRSVEVFSSALDGSLQRIDDGKIDHLPSMFDLVHGFFFNYLYLLVFADSCCWTLVWILSSLGLNLDIKQQISSVAISQDVSVKMINYYILGKHVKPFIDAEYITKYNFDCIVECLQHYKCFILALGESPHISPTSVFRFR